MGYLDIISKLAPREYLEELNRHLTHADIRIPAPLYIGIAAITSILSGIIGYFLIPEFFDLYPAVCFVLGFGASAAFFWGILVVMTDRKTKDIETSLPDTLLLIASNMRAGETIDWAIVSTLKHSYGAIYGELDKTARELASGTPLEKAMTNLAGRNKSPVLHNVVDLILFGVQSGGDMSDLLTDVSFEIRMTQTLKQDVDSQVAVYRAFFIAIILIIAPIMLAVSTNFLAVAKAFGTRLSADMGSFSTTAPMGMRSGYAYSLVEKIQSGGVGGSISMYDMTIFSYGLCAISSIVASMLLGVIATGESKSGIKYMPFFIAISCLAYYYANQLVFNMMNDMFGGIMTV